jgi:tetratricopeptide (TPR) repeat protein
MRWSSSRSRPCRALLPFAVVPLATVVSAAALPPAAPRGPDQCMRAFDRGDYAGAVAACSRRLAAAPRDAAAVLVRARAEAARGRLDEAYDGFRQALRLEPRSADALYYLGMTAGALAQRENERLLAMAPRSARALQLEGESHEAQGRPHEAAAAYQAALEIEPASVELLVAMADLMRSQLHFDEALTYYERARALAPRRYDVLYGLGVVHSFRRDHAAAVARLREALAADPASAAARFALGRSLLLAGDAEGAVRELAAAIARAPGMREAHYTLGRAYQALGRHEEAQRAFTRGKELTARPFVEADPAPEAPEPE